MKNKDKIIVIILFIVLIVLFIILIKPKNKLKTFCYNSYKIETFKRYNISNDGEALNFISKKYAITLKNIDQAFNIFEKEDFSSLNIQGKILNKTEKKYDDMNYIKLEIKDMKNKTYLLTQNQKKTWILIIERKDNKYATDNLVLEALNLIKKDNSGACTSDYPAPISEI